MAVRGARSTWPSVIKDRALCACRRRNADNAVFCAALDGRPHAPAELGVHLLKLPNSPDACDAPIFRVRAVLIFRDAVSTEAGSRGAGRHRQQFSTQEAGAPVTDFTAAPKLFSARQYAQAMP